MSLIRDPIISRIGITKVLWNQIIFKPIKEKCREAHAVEHSIECGYMNLIQSFDEAGMLIQAIIKDTSYLELESRPERSKTFPVQQNKYQQSFCNVDFILDWTDSQKRKDLNLYPNSQSHDQSKKFWPENWTPTLGSRRWNWNFREKHFEIRIQNFCYIQVIVFDVSYLPVVAYLLSPNSCHW